MPPENEDHFPSYTTPSDELLVFTTDQFLKYLSQYPDLESTNIEIQIISTLPGYPYEVGTHGFLQVVDFAAQIIEFNPQHIPRQGKYNTTGSQRLMPVSLIKAVIHGDE